LVKTSAPTTTSTGVAYLPSTNTLVITGTNFDTLLASGENATTDIQAQLNWSKLSWDSDGDDINNVSFVQADIASAKVINGSRLEVVLTNTKANTLESSASYGFSATNVFDTIDISAGFTQDKAGNSSSTDALSNAELGFKAGDSVIDLAGNLGQLSKPVQVDNGQWFYLWQYQEIRNTTDTRFTEDAVGNVRTGTDTDDTYRYTTLNGVRVSLPVLGDTYSVRSATGTAVGNATAALGSNAANGVAKGYRTKAFHYSRLTPHKPRPICFEGDAAHGKERGGLEQVRHAVVSALLPSTLTSGPLV
jgi:hypothetical protein